MRIRPVLPLLAPVVLTGLLAGCGPPPEYEPPSPPVRSPEPTALPFTPPPGGPPDPEPATGPTPSPGFAEDRAVRCDGQPDADTVLALLQAEGLLAPDTEAEVTEGPMCAGSWQYAVVDAPELDPLQVVTRGDPAELELVTAGTEVCTVDVRVLAPPGIRLTADCVG